jgi:hypothetical protein
MSGAALQAALDSLMGSLGSNFGQPFTVYRCAGSGDFPSAWTQVATNQEVFRQRVTAQRIQSGLNSAGTMFYEVVGDMTDFLLGDVFVCTDGGYVAGESYGAGATSIAGTLQFDGFGLAWHPPVRVPIAARIDRRVQIFRAAGSPIQDNAGMLSWQSTHEADQPLVLTGGTYAFGSPGQAPASFVPAGFASTERPSRGPEILPAQPDTPAIIRYYCYLPPLPGYAAQEGDAVIDEDGARYVVQHPYRQDVGVVGSQLVLERRVMPPA